MLVIKKGLDLDPTFPRGEVLHYSLCVLMLELLSVGVVYLRHISEHCSDLISQSVLVPLQM